MGQNSLKTRTAERKQVVMNGMNRTDIQPSSDTTFIPMSLTLDIPGYFTKKYASGDQLVAGFKSRTCLCFG